MRLLRADGGMHGGVHKARSRPLFGPMDLRALRRGGEGRGCPVGENDRDGGGDESAHEFLQKIQETQPAGEFGRGIDFRGQAAASEEPRLAAVGPGEEASLAPQPELPLDAAV